jgi:hypothetical protein
LRDATRLYPRLLLGIEISPVIFVTTLMYHGIPYPAVTDVYLGITVAFKPDTYLPYIVRSYEDHKIFGNSTSDFILYNYTSVAGVQFPRWIKLMYNEDNLLIDTLIDTVTVNPAFPKDFFQGIPLSEIPNTELQIPPLALQPSAEYRDAEVLKSQEYGSDLYTQHSIELLDDQSHPDGELVLYIYSDSRVGTPQKYSSGIQISGFPGKTVFHEL